MSRALKKLSHKYEFLKLELEEVKEEAEEYNKEWSILFGKYFVDKSAEMWVNEETGEVRKDLPDKEKKQKKLNPSQKLKKLYRGLSSKIHPDKGGNDEDFSALKTLYDSANLLELLKLAGEFNIDYDIDEEDEKLIMSSCDKIGKKIDNTKQSLSWVYFTGNIMKKKAVLQILKRDHGIVIPDNELPEELRS
jgi:hypothetical protein